MTALPRPVVPEAASWEPAPSITDAVAWATVTVFVWLVVLSLGVLLLRIATKRPPVWEDTPITERDEPIPSAEGPADHRDAL